MEVDYEDGNRQAWRTMLMTCCKQLGYEDLDSSRSAWILEREGAITALREVCDSFGDNDWDSSLNLYDIIDKHLTRNLHGG